MADLCEKPRVIAIGGPTATGKTALSVSLARQFDGEIISADSMQIYKGLTIGTAKASEEERQGVPHHLLDILPPETPYSVADFMDAAVPLVEQLSARGKLPIVAGGTGLYLTSLLNGITFAPEKTDPALRTALQNRAETEGPAAIYAELQAIDPVYAARVHANNLPRVIRALELYHTTGRKMSEEQAESRPAQLPYRSLCLCLTCRDRALLYRRIDSRVDSMVAAGVLREAEQVWLHREQWPTAAQAIGYKEFFPYFEEQMPLNDCVNRLKQSTRRYAKRQLTWFRRQTDAVWLYLEDGDVPQRAAALVERFVQT